MSRLHLITGVSPPRLRDRLREECLKIASERIGAALWLAPSADAAAEMRAHVGTLPQPRIDEWDSLAETLVRQLQPDIVVLSPIQLRMFLQEAIASAQQERALEYFGSIADSHGLLDDLAELLRECDEAGVAAETAIATLNTESRKQHDLARIANRLTKILYENSALAPGSLIRWLGTHLPTLGTVPLAGVQQIFVDGATDLSPARLSFLTQLAKHAPDVWMAMIEEGGEAREELFHPSRQLREKLAGCFDDVEMIPIKETAKSPPGLKHLRQALFADPPPSVSSKSAGLALIEAPGALGEARMVARRIRELLDAGVAPERILVTARRLTNRDLWAEVFDEYCVPFDLAGDEPLASDPHVKLFLKAVRLPEDDWPFADVTALLRNMFFCPPWNLSEPEMPRHAEALLRLLGEPRGDRSVLKAVDLWADLPPPALEDEQAEETRRRHKIELARRVRPFLQRFFKCWERLPRQGTPAQFAKFLRDFAHELGLPDQSAIGILFRHLEEWLKHVKRSTINRAQFFRQLTTLAANPLPAVRHVGVRIREAEAASHLENDYLFVLGLGERSFPDLSPSHSLFDDQDRQRLRDAGLAFDDPDDRLSSEMLLFLRLAALPAKELTLSYPAVDAKGQLLLPSTFLRAVHDCFATRVLQPDRQRMLLEGYFERAPLSAAERRVHFAKQIAERGVESAWPSDVLPERLSNHLRDAARMAHGRFEVEEFGVYDGLLTQPAMIAEIAKRFGPQKAFSPTALETYVACPFKFFLKHVLRLEELDEPIEEVEATRRGSAFHRALARFHHKLIDKDRLVQTLANLDETVSDGLLVELREAVREYHRTASSDAARTLWELEGKRLERFGERYHEHWKKFTGPWETTRKAQPVPRFLEADFGLPAFDEKGNAIDPPFPALRFEIEGVEVRIAGRIDRVDVADLPEGQGFWIIDYKTGRGTYSTIDLRSFKRLQLSLYAVAVEEVLLAGQARPLGLAYWLLTDSGPNEVLPGGRRTEDRFRWCDDPEAWVHFRQELLGWVAEVVGRLRQGQFPLSPRSPNCTDTCSFGQICRISQARSVGKLFDLRLPSERADR